MTNSTTTDPMTRFEHTSIVVRLSPENMRRMHELTLRTEFDLLHLLSTPCPDAAWYNRIGAFAAGKDDGTALRDAVGTYLGRLHLLPLEEVAGDVEDVIDTIRALLALAVRP